MKLSKSLFALAVVAGFTGQASATVLTFDTASACNTTPCSNSPVNTSVSTISNGYGDNSGVADMTYKTTVAGVDYAARYYSTGYGSLTDVMFGRKNSTTSVTITGDAGGLVSLNGFDVGQWATMTGTTTFTVLDSTGATLWSQVLGASGGSTTHYSLSGVVDDMLTLQWTSTGTSGDLIAVDNINISAVPEPGSMALFVAGLGFLGVATRRKAIKKAV